MAVVAAGIGTVGFTLHVWLSLFPLGNTFRIAISTIRSVATLIPVVSRSKKQIGRLSCNVIGIIYATKVVIHIFVTMRYRTIILLLTLCIYSSSWAQGLKVLRTEEKTGKRIVLVAETLSPDTLNVFLMVNAQGSRKSASKPVIKNIPPKTKVPMITLIELANQESIYTYDMYVSEEENNINLSFDSQIKDIRKNINGKVVLFTTDGCEKCTALSAKLDKERISHRMWDIKKDATIYRQFMAFIERSLTNETKIRLPVIWNRDKVIFGYDNLEEILKELQ
jgi:glutaredoxin